MSFSSLHGTCTAIVGPNGAGKTTLLKILGGAIQRYKGRVSVNGRVSLSPEISVNFPYMDAVENVRYFSKIIGSKQDPFTILMELNLVPKGQLAYTFSKGMKRKLDVARALSLSAGVILMDEPFDGLDPGASRDLALTVNSLKSHGVTFIISSHDLLRLNEIADLVIFLKQGMIAGLREMDSRSALIVKIDGDLTPAVNILNEMRCRITSTENNEVHFEPAAGIAEWDVLGGLIKGGIKVTGLSGETLDSNYRRIFLGNLD